MAAPVDVNGATFRASGNVSIKGCRALWHDGTLYIVKSVTDVMTFDCPEEPARRGGVFQAKLADAIVTIQPPGCNCKKKPALAALTLEQIVGLVSA